MFDYFLFFLSSCPSSTARQSLRKVTMESFKIAPASNAHISHFKGSRFDLQGIQAHIFIEKPPESGYENVEPNSVHLVTAPKGQVFKQFKNVPEEEKLVFGLSTYLEMLAFFETDWNNFKAEMEKKFKTIKKKNGPGVECHADIHFYLHATAYYERWFGDVFLHFKKSSTDPTAGIVYLQHGGKFIMINPDVMHDLSKSRLALVDVLFKAGYNENVVMVEIQS